MRLIAVVNRGEAAMRCIRSVKALRALEGSDLQVVALYTDVDRDAPFVRHADQAYRLPMKTTAVAAYLDHEELVRTLLSIGADAVWPGWGFVAESPEFVDRLAAADITFLGPTSETMRRLGDKIASKLLAESVKVPVTAWSGGALADLSAAGAAAEAVGYPLVIKASAGGGGRGIRMVHEADQLAAAFTSAASEAKTAFGDDRLFLEAMVRGGRHIEVQIVADKHGHVFAVGCRDCSVQRRHQKVIEEAPPVGLSEELLSAVKDSARRLAAEVSYHGVGTVEFLVCAPDFYFLEMNPRLQVEHGITEEVTGLDLVELQVRIARGESLAGLSFDEQGYCIEARVCAEDPDQGFLPAPGCIALFDPALGPRVRVDSGVARGTDVPPDFDSLIAKVMASGMTREEARSRLSAALLDFDLAIAGGATNKGYLLDLLAAEEYRAGGVDTLWLDRWTADRDRDRPFAAEALVFAAVVAYRSLWRGERANFYRDTSNITPDKVPALDGRELDLEYAGEQYRVRVYSVGALRYRVQLDGCTVSARYGETGSHTARMVVSGNYLRATYDVTDTYLHVELEGRVHRFGRQTAGQVRAGAPSMVVSVHVQVGERVEVGQPLGILEAMKMEIAFNAPVAGMVTEVRVRKGEQVAAGELLVVIDPAKDITGTGQATARLQLPAEAEPLSTLFGENAEHGSPPDLLRASSAPQSARTAALRAAAEEIRLIVLGYDILPDRFSRLVALLEAPLVEGLPLTFCQELLSLCEVLPVAADLEVLFSRARAVGEGGVLGPSNNARMRLYVRRMQSRGADLADDFVSMLQRALSHYGVTTLDYSDELERSVLRMFASQRDGESRRRLIMAVMRRLLGLIDAGVVVADRPELLSALSCLSGLRGELPNALVDTALEVQFRALEGSHRGEVDMHVMRKLQAWTERASAAVGHVQPPDELLADISLSPNMPLTHLQSWLLEGNRLRRVAAVSACMQKLYAPRVFTSYEGRTDDDGQALDVVRYDKFAVLAVSLPAAEVPQRVPALCTYAQAEKLRVIEIFLLDEGEEARHETLLAVASVLPGTTSCERITLSFVDTLGTMTCESFIANKDGCPIRSELYGIHPEAAARIDLRRYGNFRLERLPSAEDVYCFHAHAIEDDKDERIFVLADMRNRTGGDSRRAEDLIPLFERAFQDATRTMRLTLGARDPRRRLHWNRIVMHVSQPLLLEVVTAHRLARRLLPHVRHLGIEKTIVTLNLLNADRPSDPPRIVEAAFADLASSRLEVTWRRPRKNLLVPATAYERRVADARRKGQFYPYEVIRMLTHGDESTERDIVADDEQNARPVLPVGQFEEYDLDPAAPDSLPRAASVAGRSPGANQAAVVFGIISTATAKVPEGMKRVLLLSDPSLAMGALAKPECDRIVAAIDLAEQMQVPVEWIPVSSGARISMESGTENMDATADVVRRIVTFTQAGGVIHLVITGINVGAQSYWDSLATMLMYTRGALIMTPDASMVLTGRAALAASGSISAEDEVSIGGHERVMGPNGEAQYFAPDMVSAFALLYQHYDYTYVVPGEDGPRALQTDDSALRDITSFGYVAGNGGGDGGFATLGEVFDQESNPGRKRPFAMRALMRAVVDQDGGFLERWGSHAGAETAIVWDAHLGGYPVTLVGIESQNVPRLGYRPLDGPENWNGGTLFPQSSKKVARALNAASGNRPVVVLANLSGFDGSPESMRKLQLELGAEIARAVVNFKGTIAFLVVSRYHGGAYVVFSRRLNDGIRAAAVEGSFASVIGGGPAAAVVFPREVQARVEAEPRVREVRQKLARTPTSELRAEFERLRQEVTIEKRAEVAAEFDQVHSVQRALQVGSLEEIVGPRKIRPYLVSLIEPRA